MLVFGLLMLTGMLVVAGMSIDIARYESLRSKLQNTLDAAVLAAANLDQSEDPTTVVLDYMDKAGLGQYITADDVTVTPTAYSRTVAAKASGVLPSAFMRIVGIDSLTPSATSTANESIGDIEISLVLDMSSSMNDDNKIGKLRDAATQFVETMFDSTQEGKLTISVVPYAAQVTAGPELFGYFDTTKDHNYSYCIDFTQDDFKDTAMPLNHLYQQAGHFDPWGTVSINDVTTSPSLNPPSSRYICPTDSSLYILPFSADEDQLLTMIGNLTASGSTSIDVGMKWGVALLDPNAQPIVTDMIDKDERPSSIAGRPVAFDDRNVMKVVILMTDGANTPRSYLQPPYTSGDSILYTNSSDSSNYTLYDSSRSSDPYYWTIDSAWHSAPYAAGNGTYSKCTTTTTSSGRGKNKTSTTTTCSDVAAQGTATRLTWPELWNMMSVAYFTDNIYAQAYGTKAAGNLYDDIVAKIDNNNGNGNGVQDSNWIHSCNWAQKEEVTIYTISFGATQNAKALLKTCATKTSYFYDADDLDISTAFASIANSINKLRLTQ